MSGKWLSIEVLDGPQTLQGKVAKVRLSQDVLSSCIDGLWGRELGRLEFMQMYGDFTGLEKISRKHLHISHQGDRPGEFTLSDCNSTNGTEFPNGNDGREVIALLGGVLKIKVSQSLGNFTITPDSFIIPAHRCDGCLRTDVEVLPEYIGEVTEWYCKQCWSDHIERIDHDKMEWWRKQGRE